MTATISGSATSTLVALTTTGNTILGDASTDTLNVGNGGLVKDASGNVGIGTSSPSTYGKFVTYSSGGYGAIDSNGQFTSYQLVDTTTAGGRLTGGSNQGYLGSIGIEQAATGAKGGYINFLTAPTGTNTPTERARIDVSGNFAVGTTNASAWSSGAIVLFKDYGGYQALGVSHASGVASGSGFHNFAYNGAIIGSITQNGTTQVLYNISSDYRLKDNPQALTGAKDFVMALQPKKWQWWDGSGEGVGFIAHEFMEVAKHSGNGTKDAVETVEIKDEQGNVTSTEQRPVMQSIQPSSSEVMANLVSFIQEQQALITSLTTRITALEGANNGS